MPSQRRNTRRRFTRAPPAACARASDATPDNHSDSMPCLNMLPDELLLKVGCIPLSSDHRAACLPACMSACMHACMYCVKGHAKTCHVQVFAQLATVHSKCTGGSGQLCYTATSTGPECFSTIACAPDSGLRQYPFLGQVTTASGHASSAYRRL